MATNTVQDSSKTTHHIVWLDEQSNQSYNRGRLRQMRELDQCLKVYTCKTECIQYIQQCQTTNTNSYIIFIVSGALSKEMIPQIEDYTCIVTIFVFCANTDVYKDLKYEKLKAVCDDTYELIDRIELYITRSIERDIHFSLLNKEESSTSEAQYPIRNLKEDQARFLWFYHCHNHMLELHDDDDDKAKEEMIARARQDVSEQRYLASIDEFNNQSIEQNFEEVLRWYTRNSFVYKCVNTVLRQEKISKIYKYRYIIKLLCRQLKNQRQKFLHKLKDKSSFRLYRGQQLRVEHIKLLRKHRNDLISLNGFVSTTFEQGVAMRFASRYQQAGFESVLFIIDVRLNNEQDIIFADLQDVSYYPEEEEILFSVGTIFRIKSIESDQTKQLYTIHLELVQHNELNAIKYIEQTYNCDSNTLDRRILFGKLLFDMGEQEFSLEYFLCTLDRLPTDGDASLRATYLNNIGVCYNGQGNPNKAVEYYEKAQDIYTQTQNHQGLGTCYHNIASVYYVQNKLKDALNHALNALNYRTKKTLEKASTHDLLGCIYLAQNNTDAAKDNLHDALKIRQRCLRDVNPYHPDIGISYQNLGELCKKASKFADASKHYSQAAEIYRHNYPESHPMVRNVDRCLNELKK